MNETSGINHAPHSIEVEQQILGALLLDNKLFDKISGIVRFEHFYEPTHADIFKNIATRIAKELLASPITLGSDLEHHEGLADLGGAQYLTRLAGASISSFAISDYAIQIEGLYKRRTIKNALEDTLAVVGSDPDPEAAKSALEAAILTLPQGSGQASYLSLLKSLQTTIQEMSDAYQGQMIGVPTGLKVLDNRLAGFQRQNLILLAGRPSMGKTALALSLGTNAAREGFRVGIVSLEMSDSELTNRVISEASRINYSKARRGDISEDEFRKIADVSKNLSDLPMYIVPPHVRDIPGIYSALKSIKARAGGLDMVIVDYLQLVRVKGNSANERVNEISQQLKGLARLLDVPVVALSQLSRACEARDNKRPILSDLRDSGSLEQDADVVLFCYRHEYYMSRETPPDKEAARVDWEADFAACKNKMEVITAKQRMGSVGVDFIGCHMPTNRFWDLGDTDSGEMGF